MAKAAPQKNSEAAPAPPPEDELWTAARVAADMGVAVELVEGLRTTLPGLAADLRLIRGLEVFTEQGRVRVWQALDKQMNGKKSVTPAKPAAVAAAPAPLKEDLIIARVFPWSSTVMAHRANGIEVALQLKSAKHLHAGMVLKECVAGELGWYYYGRLPRGPGESQLFYPPPETTEADEA